MGNAIALPLACAGSLLLGAVVWVGSGSGLIICGRNAQEAAAQASLRNVWSAQRAFQDRRAVDRDGNGCGEFGTFAELAGTTPLRGAERPLHPPVLSHRFGSLQAGVVIQSGYVFQMWLPSDHSGGFVPEATEGGPRSAQIDDAASEKAWRCYAWPLEIQGLDRKVFVVDQEGTVYGARNRWGFEGTWRRPPVDVAAAAEPWSLAGHDGYQHGDPWVPVN